MTTLQRLQAWLNAPEVLNEEKRRQVYITNLVFKWGVIFLSITLLLWPLIADSPNAERYFYISISLVVGLFVIKFMLNRGWVDEAGHVLAAVFWIAFLLPALTYPDGMFGTPFLAAVTISPIVAGFIVGTRASIFITVLNWILGGYLTYLDINDATRRMIYFEEPIVRYLALMMVASVFPLIVYVWHRNLRDALAQVHVTEQAKAETAVYRLQNESLEEAVKARTIDLENALTREKYLAEQLKQALAAETQLGELQSRIITVVSHEFRTPLAVIHSSAELLQHYYDKLSKERKAAAHQRIGEAVFYLNDLLKGVNLVGQAQRERIQPVYQTYSFNELCHRLKDELLFEINQPKRIQFEYVPTIETALQTDFTLLTQIVSNLVSNGLKYSEISSPVQVHLWLDGPQLVIEVQDQGIGIPLQEQDKIFELFYRASNVDERRGLGLGLFIVQAVSKMMQGQVAFVSQEYGQGSTFQICLPLAPVSELLTE